MGERKKGKNEEQLSDISLRWLERLECGSGDTGLLFYYP